ncbi:MAG: hypothetical protein R6X25_02020 [Candidatus Krumholzibacteriia bacterium]
MRQRHRFLRDFEAGRRIDLMLVSAVTAVLGIRAYLALSGYPQVGGESLHIAHMLWGGLLMAAGLLVQMSFVSGRTVHQVAAILGGLGFGTFIDEIGKFVTRDNDYFYQPAVSLIYVSLILLYLAGRSIHRDRIGTGHEYLANAVEEVLEIARGDLDEHEQARALRYLEQSGRRDRLARGLAEILRGADLVEPGRPSPVARGAGWLVAQYRAVAGTRTFGLVLIVFFSLQFLAQMVRLFALADLLPAAPVRIMHVPVVNPLPASTDLYEPSHWLQLGSGLLAGAFVAGGMILLFRQRLRALRMFQRAVLVNVFLTQVFVFYRVEWAGLVGLAFNLLLFFALRFAVEREQRWREEQELRTSRPHV